MFFPADISPRHDGRLGRLTSLWRQIRSQDYRRFFVYRYPYHGSHPLSVTRLVLTGPNIDPEWCNLRLFFLSDLHFRGHPIEDRLFEFLVIHPWDMLMLGGDYQPERFDDPQGIWTQRFIRKLRHYFPRHPVVAVRGNHDSPRVVEILKSYGVYILEDEALRVNVGLNQLPLGILGTRDPHRYVPNWKKIKSARECFSGTTHWILLTHSPDILMTLPKYPEVRLILTGHTHGGQIALGRYRPLWYNTRVRREFASGLSRVRNTWVYTSRGFGYTFAPLRVWCPPEIVEVRFSCYTHHGLRMEEEYLVGHEEKIYSLKKGHF